jgi:hypothetical protein
MFNSNNFTTSEITYKTKVCKLEYEDTPMQGNSLLGSGNLYLNGDNEEPMEFTFATLNDKIMTYTPMNCDKELIGNIVEIITGKRMPVADLL